MLAPGLVLPLVALAAVPAAAMPMTQDYTVDFSSPTEAIWGPGKSSASFHYNQVILGSTSFGMRFETGASTGTVSSHYNGGVSVAYDDTATPGTVPLNISYNGDSNGGQFATALGAFAKVTAYLPVVGGVVVTNPNYSLQTGDTYTPSPPDSASGSDSFTPASTTIGPDIGAGAAQAGIDYDIVENSTHTISGLDGTIVATNQTTGHVRSAPFSLAASTNLSLNLDEVGIWDVQLTGLSLDNLFSTTFSLAAVPFVQYYFGFGCGDPSSNSDNAFTCVSDDRLDTTLASFPFFTNTPFGLALTSSDALPSFAITVATAVASAPEPASVGLLGLGIAAIGVARRRRSRETV